jgi:hypothetical protein
MTLALTSEQLAAVHQAADAVPPNYRSRFLAALQDLLLPNPTPSNRDVLEAINQARRSFAIGTSPSGKERRGPYEPRRRASGAGQ